VKIGPDPAVGGQDRAVVFIKVRIEDKDLWVGTSHLDHVANDANRIYQAKAIKPILESLDAPFVFGGDFNDEPGSKTIEIMSQYTTFAYRSATQYTFPSNMFPHYDKQLLDYVTYYPRDSFIERGYNVLHTVKASDHMPVVAVFNMDY
jgi:endonuclease/exonuclease/phosphatase family metal-dependent hydrolase